MATTFREGKPIWQLVCLVIGALCLAGCSQSNQANPKKVTRGRAELTGANGKASSILTKQGITFGSLVGTNLIAKEDEFGTPLDVHGRPIAFSDRDAIATLVELCSGCHGPGQSVHASWAFPDAQELSVAKLESLERIEVAYQAVLKKYVRIADSSPSPMPPRALEKVEMAKLGQLLAWMQDSFPSKIAQAENAYTLKAPFQSSKKVTVEYRCNSVLEGNPLLSRFVTTVLGRPVKAEDESLFTSLEKEGQSAGKSGDELSLFLASKLADKAFNVTGPWFQEVVSAKGALFTLAQKIASVGAIGKADLSSILPAGVQESALKSDLKQEFFQLLKAQATLLSYKDILLHNKVMVSKNTAPLYGCSVPASDNEWVECELNAVRGNFFGTRGFLIAKPSSFLTSNNNYGRGGDLYSAMSGSVLMANTDGISGDMPEPLPTCMKTEDVRWRVPQDATKKAPWGALAVPAYGRVCQGCHLNRNLAAASYVFRPFGVVGEEISEQHLRDDAQALAAPTSPPVAAGRPNYRDSLKLALSQYAPEVRNMPETAVGANLSFNANAPADIDSYIRMLLESKSESASMCSPSQADAKATVSMKTMNELVSASIGNGAILVEGFTRFFPSAFLNSSKLSNETRQTISEAYKTGNGMLIPILKAYFSSRSFICAMEVKVGEN